ncbi:hypothetical protein [Micromonospora sp. CPCC 205556]|uniref:hypothetical protein n=1 Tax=Micromonospora sp. CPCC 205556 TaxID=3122398 RepID=UPI002FEEE981
MRSDIAHRRTALVITTAVTLLSISGCGQDGASVGATWQSGVSASPAAGGAKTTAPAGGSKQKISAACPLVDMKTIDSTFNVTDVKAEENKPVKSTGATTYACDFANAGRLFLTVGVSVAPDNGSSAAANVRAALSNRTGEPLNGIGDTAAYDEAGGIGSVAAAKVTGSQMRVLIVHGAPDDKEALIKIAQSVAPKI